MRYFSLVSWGGSRHLRARMRDLREIPRRANPATVHHDQNRFPQYMRRAANIFEQSKYERPSPAEHKIGDYIVSTRDFWPRPHEIVSDWLASLLTAYPCDAQRYSVRVLRFSLFAGKSCDSFLPHLFLACNWNRRLYGFSIEHHTGSVDCWLRQIFTRSLGTILPSFRILCVSRRRFSPPERHM